MIPSGLRVKICGLSTPDSVAASIDAGAGYLGFVFFPPSPRGVTPDQAAALAAPVPPGLAKVGLFVDAEDAFLEDVLARCPLDMLQLHGSESPARAAEIRARFGLPVMKALPIAEPADVEAIAAYEGVADQILCDAKPRPDAALPGGGGHAFDWRLLAGRRWTKPWMLAGGLTAETLAEAVAVSGARQVDVSSGVESSRGVKDAGLIQDFLKAAKAIAL